jgi:hypothetical protein
MKNSVLSLCLLIVTAVIASSLCGCGESKTTPPDSNAVTPPSRSAVEPTPTAKPVAESAAPAKPAVETSTPVATTPVKAAVTDLSAQFAQAAAAQTDKLLGSIGGDLAGKVKSLSQSLGVNDALKSQLDGALQSLTAGKDSTALGQAFQVAQAATNLTPEQQKLAKEVGNLTSAFVVQKNFSSLDGAQGDVASVVNALRQGNITAAIPPLQKVAQNAGLTPSQKQLVTSLADQYAPGLSKAAGTLQQGLKSLPGLKQ